MTAGSGPRSAPTPTRTPPGRAQYGVKTKAKNDTRVADVFNRLAEGLALASFQPGGVTFAGMHFEYEPDVPDEPSCNDVDGMHQLHERAVEAAEAVDWVKMPRPVETLPPDSEGRL